MHICIPKSRQWTEKDQRGSWEASEGELLSMGEIWLVVVETVAMERFQRST